MTYSFRPAASFTERHGCFVALVGGTNSGKTVSGLRLARGIAGPTGKVAVIDTEGGRTLHLRDAFDFDVMMMEPPHRPDRYLEAARSAQDAGYDVVLIDSFTAPWRGVGGVLDWTDDELDIAVARAKANAEQRGYHFDEAKARFTNKLSASIRPKMAWKLMVFGLLGLRVPVIFSIRGETTLDADTKKEVFKAQMQRDFPFEVTVSFRLRSEAKGIIDLSDPKAWKMEGAHRSIFRDGDQLSEAHGAALAAWARGEGAEAAQQPAQAQAPAGHGGWPVVAPDGATHALRTAKGWGEACRKAIGALEDVGALDGWMRSMLPHFEALTPLDADAVGQVEEAAMARRAQMVGASE